MANKRYTTEMRIKAVDQYSKIVKGIPQVTGRAADRIRKDLQGLQKMRGPLKLIEDFRKQKEVLAKSGQSLDKARARVRELLAEIKASKQPTAAMRREFERARTAADRLEQKHAKNRKTLNSLRGQLQGAGVNTADLAAEQRRLNGAIDAASGPFNRQIERMRRMADLQKRIAEERERMDRSLATAANLSFVGHASITTGRRILDAASGPVNEAKAFETAMADVKKVVDFDSPEAFQQMKDDIQALATDKKIPLLAEEIAEIVAAGGQSGIAKENLIQFAELAAKVGVAFDISADKSGEAMAKIRTAMDLDLDQTAALFDAMNHLSNKSAAEADQTLDFLNRAGADGANFGFNANETLSIGAAMIAAGAQADTAATSFRNMGRALTRGESATKRQSGAFRKLGLDAEEVAKRMQQDAVGTTMDVMKRMGELPDHLRASVMSDLFGDEARELTKLINNLELTPRMLNLVNDPQKYLGSADAEFKARSETTENNETLTQNEWKRLKNTAGETILPVYNEILVQTREILAATTDWIKEHPKLTKWLLVGGTALGAMAIAGGALLTAAAGLIGAMAVLRFGMAGFGARAMFASGGLRGLTSRILGLSRARPDFGPAQRGFSGFRRSALSEMDLLKSGVDTRAQAINRSLSRLKWKGAFAGLTTYLAMQQIPDDPQEFQAFQEENRRRMDSTFRATPGLGWMMKKYEAARDWMHGPPSQVDGAFLPEDPGLRQAAQNVQGFAGSGDLPTAERIAALREEVAAYQQEVVAARQALGQNPEFASGILNPQRVQAQADLDAAEAGLEAAKGALAEAEAGAADLAEALKVLEGTNVAPEVNASSIDSALRKVDALRRGLSALPDGTAGGPQTSIGPAREVVPLAGARAKGGPMRAGLPYLAGELGPEPIFSSRSAFVATHRQLQGMLQMAQGIRSTRFAALTAAAVSLPALAVPSFAAALPSAAASPGAGSGKHITVEIGSITIPVQAGAADPRGVADALSNELGARLAEALKAKF